MPDSLDDPLAAQRAKSKAGEVATEDETRRGCPEVLARHTREMKVPKKPLASWIRLVAMISVPICAHINRFSFSTAPRMDNRLSSSILPGSARRRRNGAAEMSPWEGQS